MITNKEIGKVLALIPAKEGARRLPFKNHLRSAAIAVSNASKSIHGVIPEL